MFDETPEVEEEATDGGTEEEETAEQYQHRLGRWGEVLETIPIKQIIGKQLYCL